MSDLLKVLFLAAATVVGAAGGAFAALWATPLGCGVGDWLTGGGGLMAVGWLFWLGTVPMGFFFGACAGFYLAFVMVRDDDVYQ